MQVSSLVIIYALNFLACCVLCRAEELKDKICKYGEVRDCYLPRDFHTQRPRGFGFVEFAGDRRDAEDAIKALDGSDFRGREITVCFSREVRS